MTIRALLDSNVLDYLLAEPSALERLRVARKSGDVVLVEPHILRDELNAITDDGEKWAQLEAIRGVLDAEAVPTNGVVLNVSRLEAASLMSWDDVETFANLTADHPKHAKDGLLALTASSNGAILVTQDRRLRNRANAEGIEAIDASTFIARLPQ